MNTRHYLKMTGAWTLAAVLGITALCGCDNSFIYDNEGDCSIHVRFKYDYNTNYGDAFWHEVTEVTLYVLDEEDNIVLSRTESGAPLAQDDYCMVFTKDELAPGNYKLMAWAKGYDTQTANSWTIPSASNAHELTCSLNWATEPVEGWNFSNKDLDRLYHSIDTLGTLHFPEQSSTTPYVFTVPLMRDTNGFRIQLQHVLGGEMDTEHFSFFITDDNGVLDWDNSLILGNEVLYYPWWTGGAVAEGEIDEPSEQQNTRADGDYSYNSAVAEFTTGRLLSQNNPTLTVVNTLTGKTIFSIPIREYLLMMKSQRWSAMDDQEYLDRENYWSMTFFLDDMNDWMNSYIYINSWKLVLQSANL